jgi:tetratricopeptide (TPR) repeat protein
MTVGICWAVLLGGGFAKWWPQVRARQILQVGTAVLLALLSVMSYRQTFLWQTNVGFFTQLLAGWKEGPVFLPRRVDLYMHLARAHSQRGEFSDAIDNLQAAVRLAPEYPEARIRLGDALMAAGQLDAARASYEAAARLDPKFSPPLNDLGVAFAQQGKLDRAIEQFSEVLRNDSSNRSALQNIATALQHLGRTNEAEVYLAKLNGLPARAPNH